MSLPEALVSAQKPFKRQPGTRVMNITIMLLDPSNSSHPYLSLKPGAQKKRKHLGETWELYYTGPYLHLTNHFLALHIEIFQIYTKVERII